MSEAFLVQKMPTSGGSISSFATIAVKYSSGATLTCTDGVKTFTADTGSTQWIFIIPYAATWVITATDGTNTKTEEVSITEEGQHESIYVMLPFVLVDANVYADETGSFSSTNLNNDGINVYVSHYGTSANLSKTSYSNSAINVEGYTQIHYTITTAFAKAGGSWSVGLSTTTGTSGYVASLSKPSVGTHSIDISSLSSSYYLVMQVNAWVTNGSTWTEGSLTVSKIWLT